MTALLALSILLASPTDLAAEAVNAALAVPGTHAQVLEVQVVTGRACPTSRAETLHKVSSSGEVPLRLEGVGPDGLACQVYAWAKVRVLSKGLSLNRAVAPGEALVDVVTLADVELRQGRPAPLTLLPSGGRAAHALAAGAPLYPDDVRDGPLPGEPITVVVRSGNLELTQTGRAMPCDRGHACALLPGGRRVEGRPEGGQLILEAP